MSSSFGTLFRVSTFGESHGGGVGVVIDGCPPRLPVDLRRSNSTWIVAVPASRDSSPSATKPTRPRSCRGLRGLHDRHADRDRRPQQGPQQRRLRPPSRRLPPFPRRLHLRREIRFPQLGRRRTRLSPRDHRPGRRCGDRPEAPGTVAGIEVLGWVDQVADIDASVDGPPSTLHRSKPIPPAAPTRTRPHG